jgi:hypothetical protein
MLTFSLNTNSNSIIKELSSKVFQPTTQQGREWLSELWFKALEGKVDENANSNAYGYVCEQNTKMAKAKRETALLTAEERSEGLKGVSESAAAYKDINIENILEHLEVKPLVEEFVGMHEYLIVEEGVNLWKIVTLVCKYNQKAIEKLQNLIKEYHMETLIRAIIYNKECLGELEVTMDY